MNVAGFVIAAAQLGAGCAKDGRLTLDRPELWADVLALAIEHRIAPLVSEGLARLPEVEVPERVRHALRGEVLRTAATRLLCERALLDIVRLLREQGVEVLVLKGASVAHTLYPRPDLRIYHDIDLVCLVSDYPKVHAALGAHGYPSAGTTDARGTQEALAHKPGDFESHIVRAFYDPSGDVKIEVHFDTLQLGLFDRRAKEYWRRSRLLAISDVEIRVLCPEHQFLQLAAHAHRHCYSRLNWLIELDIFLRRHAESVDWAEVAAVARDEGIGTVLRHAFATTHELFATPLPALPRPTLEERALGACYRLLWPFEKARSLNQHEHHRLSHFLPDDDDPRNFLYGLVLFGRRREKIQALWRRLVSPSA